jgi:hypothetical protein
VYNPALTCKISLLAGINIGAIHEGFKDYGMALKFYEEVLLRPYFVDLQRLRTDNEPQRPA